MWAALDVFVGLVLCYAMISLICSVIQEFIAQAINSRGALLVEALKSVNLEGVIEQVRPDLVANPGGLFRPFKGWGDPKAVTPAKLEGRIVGAIALEKAGGEARLEAIATKAADVKAPAAPRLPHDIPADVFVRGLIAQLGLKIDASGALNLAAVNKAIAQLPPALGTRIRSLSDDAKMSFEQFSLAISDWYAGFLGQVEHWYTRRAQAISLVIALLVALALKVDTIGIATSLHADSVQREAVVALATKYAKEGKIGACSGAGATEPLDASPVSVQACVDAVQKAYPLPLGWRTSYAQSSGFWAMICSFVAELFAGGAIVGILISGLALSLGSRFWFDQLKSLLSLRTGGQPPKPAS
jgi:hypothetical protein